MTSILFRSAAAASTLMIASASAVVVWLSLFDEPWLTYPVLPFPVLIPTVHADESIPLSVQRCNSGKATRTYISSHSLVSIDRSRPEIVLPPIFASVKPGCSPVESHANLIPRDTRPGFYRIEGLTEINGAVRNFSLAWMSEPFEVVP